MSRTGLFVALSIAAVVGLVFGLYPQLDLWMTGLLFNPQVSTFDLRMGLIPVRNAAMWLVAALAAPAARAGLSERERAECQGTTPPDPGIPPARAVRSSGTPPPQDHAVSPIGDVPRRTARDRLPTALSRPKESS